MHMYDLRYRCSGLACTLISMRVAYTHPEVTAQLKCTKVVAGVNADLCLHLLNQLQW